MNPVMRVGTGSVPSALHTTRFTIVDDVEVVPTVQGVGSWVESMIQQIMH